MDKKITLGLVGAIHPNMPGGDIELYKRIIDEMKVESLRLDYNLFFISEPIKGERDASRAAREIGEQQVDLILFFNASLPYGRVILPFADLGIPIALWSVPEPASSGVLQLNSFCGLNMLGAILRNYFPDEDVKYKWLYGMPGSEIFRERFEILLKALRALKSLRTARIGQIGDLADGFENLYSDERLLHKRFGTYIQTRHTVEEIVARAESITGRRVEKAAEQVLTEGVWQKNNVTGNSFDKFLRVNLAFEDFAEEHEYDALAISCWSRFQEVYDIAVCGAMSRLNEKGIVAPCEADIPSAVTMLMLNALNNERASLSDLVALDESDGSVNLWHCGVAPTSWSDEKGVTWDAHFNIGRYENDQWKGDGVVADMAFKPGKVTVCSLGNQFDRMFLLSGEVMKGKKGFNGSSGWMNKLEINGIPVTMAEFINTVSICQVNHHYPAALGHLVNELNELAFWKQIKVINPVPYKPYMQPFKM